MKSFLLTVEEVSTLILNGNLLILAGDEKLLSSLPSGNWIAGTIPYFMDKNGGVKTKEKIYTIDLTSFVKNFNIQFYNKENIHSLHEQYFDNGFSYIIIPSFSEIHKFYAENCYRFNGLFKQPLIGWISGFDLDDTTQETGKVFSGITKKTNNTEAVVLHVELIDDFLLNLGMVNLFEPGNGDVIQFTQTDFKIKNCIINDSEISFAKYLIDNEIDTTLPLVTYFNNNKINVSFKEVNLKEDYVEFYAPVFPGVDYQLARAVGLYELEFDEIIGEKKIKPLLSCNCILNFLYASLEGKKTGEITGPITFGEISHVLLNQTMVYLEVRKK